MFGVNDRFRSAEQVAAAPAASERESHAIRVAIVEPLRVGRDDRDDLTRLAGCASGIRRS